ncbi:hypothetical protein KC333_g110 [Hortaea werneckii]|nr:hypothetical protein KC333_g110 [Hortaea werneckii]
MSEPETDTEFAGILATTAAVLVAYSVGVGRTCVLVGNANIRNLTCKGYAHVCEAGVDVAVDMIAVGNHHVSASAPMQIRLQEEKTCNVSASTVHLLALSLVGISAAKFGCCFIPAKLRAIERFLDCNAQQLAEQWDVEGHRSLTGRSLDRRGKSAEKRF